MIQLFKAWCVIKGVICVIQASLVIMYDSMRNMYDSRLDKMIQDLICVIQCLLVWFKCFVVFYLVHEFKHFQHNICFIILLCLFKFWAETRAALYYISATCTNLKVWRVRARVSGDKKILLNAIFVHLWNWSF